MINLGLTPPKGSETMRSTILLCGKPTGVSTHLDAETRNSEFRYSDLNTTMIYEVNQSNPLHT